MVRIPWYLHFTYLTIHHKSYIYIFTIRRVIMEKAVKIMIHLDVGFFFPGFRWFFSTSFHFNDSIKGNVLTKQLPYILIGEQKIQKPNFGSQTPWDRPFFRHMAAFEVPRDDPVARRMLNQTWFGGFFMFFQDICLMWKFLRFRNWTKRIGSHWALVCSNVRKATFPNDTYNTVIL